MRCQQFKSRNYFTMHLLLVFICLFISTTFSLPSAEFAAQPIKEEQIVVIEEDVIPDVDNTTQKIIRINPLELPAIRDDSSPNKNSDSELFKIKPILPPKQRSYVNLKRMRRPRLHEHENQSMSSLTPIIRIAQQQQQPINKFRKPKGHQSYKQKQLHFLYNQHTPDGRNIGKRMRIRIAPGAYPVYYAVAKTNGRFGKFPIKSFSNDKDFTKYLIKSKLDPIEIAQRYES